MEQIRAFVEENPRTFAVAVAAVTVSTVGVIVWRRNRRERPAKQYPAGTVILHQAGRAPFAPSMVPFAVKLETFLRMARIPYENVHSMKRSPKGKFPWMEYNGETVADSSLCIEYLNKALNIDLNKHLSPSDRGIARAFQKMTEENLYWTLALFRLCYGYKQRIFDTPVFGPFTLWMIGRYVRKATWYHGIGRHSEEEVLQIAHDDLKAISDFLGDKKFIFGDDPCETDCAIFGMLCQVCWQAEGNPLHTVFHDKFPKLVKYCDRMRDTFWPDWNECITHGGTTEATR